MIYVIVALLAVLGFANIVLTLALARQLRWHGQKIAALRRAAAKPPLLSPGTKIGEFTATTASGDIRSLDDFIGAPSIFGFFMVHCPPCKQKVSEFKAYVRAVEQQGARALAVVCGHQDLATEYVRELEDAMPVVVEPPMGPALTAFSVSNYPAFFSLDPDGRVESSGATVRSLTSRTTDRAAVLNAE